MGATLRRTLVALVALAAAGGCGREPPPEPAEVPGRDPRLPGPGRLVMVGGALSDEHEELYRAVLEGRLRDGPLCVLPTASDAPAESMTALVAAFERHGGPGSAEGVLLTVDAPQAARTSAIARRLRRCGGFFLSGGQPARIADVLLGPQGEATPALEAMRARFEAGAVMAGSSAGAAALSDPMIAGGTSAEALELGVQSARDGAGVWIAPGLGFFGGGPVDPHFLARGRIGRLVVAVAALGGGRLGFGVDEGAALVVDREWVRVAGRSGVVVVDARSSDPLDEGTGHGSVQVFLLGPGDRFDLANRIPVPGEGRSPVPPGASPVAPPGDAFAPWAFSRLLADLAASADTAVEAPAASRRIRVAKAPGFRALRTGTEVSGGASSGLFAGPFRVDVGARAPPGDLASAAEGADAGSARP